MDFTFDELKALHYTLIDECPGESFTIKVSNALRAKALETAKSILGDTIQELAECGTGTVDPVPMITRLEDIQKLLEM